jgi:uncharacterized protein
MDSFCTSSLNRCNRFVINNLRRIVATSMLVVLCGFASFSQDLISAVQAGDSAQVESLLAQGANPNQVDNLGRSPLLLASLAGRTDIAVLLINHSADVNLASLNGTTPLIAAANLGLIDLASLLVDHDASVTLQDIHHMGAYDYVMEANWNSPQANAPGVNYPAVSDLLYNILSK